jgi:hypothetical protein
MMLQMMNGEREGSRDNFSMDRYAPIAMAAMYDRSMKIILSVDNRSQKTQTEHRAMHLKLVKAKTQRYYRRYL